MPPPHARTALSSSIRCNACVNSSVTRRAFASSPAPRQVGPESPRYIDVPKPLQQKAPYKPVVKGSLPVPRNIFINRSRLEKDSKEFLDNATREPSTAASLGGLHADRLAWKQRLSALRRKNLREGVTSLHKRKQRSDEFLAKRGTQRQNQQLSLINQRPRDDEVFTNPSVSKVVRDFLSGVYNTVSDKNVLQKKAVIARREAGKTEHRKEALHKLYTHAKEYILTEDQLSKAIEDTFGTEDNLPGFATGNSKQGRSIWARGSLLNTAQMLAANQGRSNRAVTNKSSPEVTQKRIHQIAEELTGGKIPRQEDAI
ncbi:lipid phosphate phosphatase 2 [Diplodia corticola]|uniref:Lipid phosphate phosphatase 2 n=1 Tax=Diplodia corticola TaxID=236234 RepID=A0A1J9SAJ2_9PEZI|nr:lipid phosphate phosphatase 2 [Diplodia corticola]OJD36892.1 lipid phosphate phosphatase 2 [Diplodia corticola]